MSKRLFVIPREEVIGTYDSNGETKEWFAEGLAVAQLLLDEVVFVNGRNYLWEGADQGETIVVFLSCNDVFAWGCADAEPIPLNKLRELYEMHMKDPKWGTAKWCIKKRKEFPQDSILFAMKADGAWDLDESQLQPNTYEQFMAELREKRKNQA